MFVSKNGKSVMTFVFVKKGEMKYTFSDKTYTVTEGCGIFVPKELPYKAEYLADGTTTLVMAFNLTSNTDLSFLSEVSYQTSHEYGSIFGSITTENIRNPFFLLSKSYELINLMSKKTVDIPKEYMKISPALNEITKNYFENHSITHYAAMCQMKESNFRRLFKEYTGKTVVEYINELRIDNACYEMAVKGTSVTRAAYDSGFNDLSYFCKVFKAYKGVTPRAYKKME